MERLTISIITPCMNRVAFVSEAVESLYQQRYSQLEHLVIDGGSTDGTLEALRGYPHLTVVSEPDLGVYDALNKGIRLARGEVIGLLNTDDHYAPGVLTKVADLFDKHPHSMAVLGGACIFSQAADESRQVVAVYPAYDKRMFLEQVTWGVPLFNAWFFRRELFDEVGFFNLHYRYAADRDFLIQLALADIQYSILNETVYFYRQHAGSLTFNGRINAESAMVLEFRSIAEKFLKHDLLSSYEKRCFRYWHSLITSHQVLLAMRSFQAARSLNYAQIGMRLDPGWLGVFARQLAESGARRLFGRSTAAVPVDAAGA